MCPVICVCLNQVGDVTKASPGRHACDGSNTFLIFAFNISMPKVGILLKLKVLKLCSKDLALTLLVLLLPGPYISAPTPIQRISVTKG